jgi:hypothetical protein
MGLSQIDFTISEKPSRFSHPSSNFYHDFSLNKKWNEESSSQILLWHRRYSKYCQNITSLRGYRKAALCVPFYQDGLVTKVKYNTA